MAPKPDADPKPTPPTDPPAADPPSPPDPLAEFQAKLDAVAGQARSEGKRTAEKQFAELFGDKTPEEIAAALKAAEQADLEKLSEADRAKVEAETLQAAAAADRATAKRELTEAKLRTALLTPGGDDAPAVNPDYLDQAVRLALDEALADEEKGIETAVDGLRKSMPLIFATGDAGKPPTATPPPSSGKPGGEGSGSGGKSVTELADDVFAAWKGKGRLKPSSGEK